MPDEEMDSQRGTKMFRAPAFVQFLFNLGIREQGMAFGATLFEQGGEAASALGFRFPRHGLAAGDLFLDGLYDESVAAVAGGWDMFQNPSRYLDANGGSVGHARRMP
jgi:hypothetical protein